MTADALPPAAGPARAQTETTSPGEPAPVAMSAAPQPPEDAAGQAEPAAQAAPEVQIQPESPRDPEVQVEQEVPAPPSISFPRAVLVGEDPPWPVDVVAAAAAGGTQPAAEIASADEAVSGEASLQAESISAGAAVPGAPHAEPAAQPALQTDAGYAGDGSILPVASAEAEALAPLEASASAPPPVEHAQAQPEAAGPAGEHPPVTLPQDVAAAAPPLAGEEPPPPVDLAPEAAAPVAEVPSETPAPAPAAPEQPSEGAAYPPGIDVEALTRNMTRLMEEGGRALSAYFLPREGANRTGYADEFVDAVKTLGQVAEYWYADPQRTVEMQARLGRGFLELFTSMSRRLAGEPAEPAVRPDPRDKRFSDPEWSSNEYFDFIKQAYLIIADWATYLVDHADKVDPSVRQRADFYVRQVINAMAPSNFLFTNPVLLRTTLSKSAENLARGARMLAEDIEAGGGELKIRQSDMSMFEVGRNLATTPGKVIYQNDLMQLIQYAPATERVLKRPLLIVPPWINKFYVLDLTPEKSYIRWCVEQGLTVFVISWVNPDRRHAGKDFGAYMREGPLTALDVIGRITGEEKVSAIGYCVGGTLLAVTLAYMAGMNDERIASATFLAAQVDFTYAGDLKVFASTEDQVAAIERHMAERGYLEGAKMAAAFNLLRSNELIWPYVVNNYMKGEAPFAFDLLYWNADSTRMPAANHSYYLRNCYLENNLVNGKLTLDNVTLDVGRVTMPVYNLATRDDHIAPAKSVYLGSQYFAGPVRYVLSGSGHIAGVVNPPAKHKYQYWTGDAPHGEDLDAWLRTATQHPGSWWPDWLSWLKAQDAAEVAAREPGSAAYPPLEDAPGSYVKVRS